MMAGPRKDQSFHDADYCLLARARLALRSLLRSSESAARKLGVGPQQYQLLIAVRGYRGTGAPTVGEIADDLFIERHSAVGLIDRLEETGLLTRQREEEDARRVALLLTKRAEKVLSEMAVVHRDELRRLAPFLRVLLDVESSAERE